VTQGCNESRPSGLSDSGTQPKPVTPPSDPKPFPAMTEERGIQRQVPKSVEEGTCRKE